MCHPTRRQEVAAALAAHPAFASAGCMPHVHPAVDIAVMAPSAGPKAVDYSACGGRRLLISRKAGEAVLRGADVFAPGVLACSAGVSRGDLVAVGILVEKPGCSNAGVSRGTTLREGPAAAAAAAAAAATSGCGSSSNGGDIDLAGGVKAGGGSCTSSSTVDLQEYCRGLYVGVGRALMSRSEMFRASHGAAVTLESAVFTTPSCQGLLPGKFMLQNLPSIVAALSLCPAPGSAVLDMCSSPGGKATLLAQLMVTAAPGAGGSSADGGGRVVALDRTHAKAAEVASLAAELGVSDVVEAHKADATKLLPPLHLGKPADGAQTGAADSAATAPEHSGDCRRKGKAGDDEDEATARLQDVAAAHGRYSGAADSAASSSPLQSSQAPNKPADSAASAKVARREATRLANCLKRGLPPPLPLATSLPPAPTFAPESFDAILCDAPCSALGLRPRLLQPATLPLLRSTAAYQRRLLDQAVRLLRPGGHLVYSTCTINPGENEANVRWLLEKYDGVMALVPTGTVGDSLAGPGLLDPDVTAADTAAPGAFSSSVRLRHLEGRRAVENGCGGLGAADHSCGDVQSDGSGDGAAATGTAEQRPAAAAATTSLAHYCERWLSSPEHASLVLRFDPCGPGDTIGFFVAKFVKLKSTNKCC